MCDKNSKIARLPLLPSRKPRRTPRRVTRKTLNSSMKLDFTSKGKKGKTYRNFVFKS